MQSSLRREMTQSRIALRNIRSPDEAAAPKPRYDRASAALRRF